MIHTLLKWASESEGREFDIRHNSEGILVITLSKRAGEQIIGVSRYLSIVSLNLSYNPEAIIENRLILNPVLHSTIVEMIQQLEEDNV